MTYAMPSTHLFSMSYTYQCLGKNTLKAWALPRRFSYKLHNIKYSRGRPFPRGGYINVTGCESGVVWLTATTLTSRLPPLIFSTHKHYISILSATLARLFYPPLLVYLFLELGYKYKAEATFMRLPHYLLTNVKRDVGSSTDDVSE